MEQDAVQKIQQRLLELPDDIRAAIQSSDLHAKIVAIGGKYQLHIDQVGELEDEVMLAMLGFSPLERLGRRLAEVLRLTPQLGEQLSGDINVQLFGSIRESMKRFAAQKAAAANPTSAPAAPPAVAMSMPKAASIPIPVAATPQKPPLSPDMHKADVILTEKTISVPPPVAPKAPAPVPKTAAPVPAANPIYKTDPYREPV